MVIVTKVVVKTGKCMLYLNFVRILSSRVGAVP